MPPLLQALQRLLQRPGRVERQNRVTKETVEEVTGRGRYIVRGVELSTTGNIPLAAGQRVNVSWRNGRPQVILAHSARRAQFLSVPRGVLGVVEELFIAVDPETGSPDIWFRNHSVVSPLGARTFLPGDPEGVRWGLNRDSFWVRTSGNVYTIFRLIERDPDSVLSVGDIPDIEVVRVEEPLTAGIRFFKHTRISGSSGTARGPFFVEGSTRSVSFSNETTATGEFELNSQAATAGAIVDVILTRELDLLLMLVVRPGDLTPVEGGVNITKSADYYRDGPDILRSMSTSSSNTIPQDSGVFNIHAWLINVTQRRVEWSTAGRDVTVDQRRSGVITEMGFLPTGFTVSEAIANDPALASSVVNAGPAFRTGIAGLDSMPLAALPPSGTLTETIVDATQHLDPATPIESYWDPARAGFVETPRTAVTSVTTAITRFYQEPTDLTRHFRWDFSQKVDTTVITIDYTVQAVHVLRWDEDDFSDSRILPVVERFTNPPLADTEEVRLVVLNGIGQLLHTIDSGFNLTFTALVGMTPFDIEGRPIVLVLGPDTGATEEHVLLYVRSGGLSGNKDFRERILTVDYLTGQVKESAVQVTSNPVFPGVSTFTKVEDLDDLQLVFIRRDFTYAAEEDRRIFVDAFDPETGEPTLDLDAAEFPIEESDLDPIRELADLESSIDSEIQSRIDTWRDGTKDGSSAFANLKVQAAPVVSFHVVNDATQLGRVGRFEAEFDEEA